MQAATGESGRGNAAMSLGIDEQFRNARKLSMAVEQVRLGHSATRAISTRHWWLASKF